VSRWAVRYLLHLVQDVIYRELWHSARHSYNRGVYHPSPEVVAMVVGGFHAFGDLLLDFRGPLLAEIEIELKGAHTGALSRSF
jgi:hypothetical protein